MYLLTAGKRAFIKLSPETTDVTVVEDYERATIFSTIGEAMEKASYLNDSFDCSIIRVVRYK